jgi:hypothetical protein
MMIIYLSLWIKKKAAGGGPAATLGSNRLRRPCAEYGTDIIISAAPPAKKPVAAASHCSQSNKNDEAVKRKNRPPENRLPALEVYSAAEMCHRYCMSTVTEIQDAIDKLSGKEKTALAAWLESRETPFMSPEEEEVLLSRLDQASVELDAGKGVSLERVRTLVTKWATR